MNAYRSAEWIGPVLLFVGPVVLCPGKWRSHLIAALIALLGAVAICSVGFSAILGTLGLFLGAFAIGARLRALVFRSPVGDLDSLDLPLGLSILTAVFGLLAQFASIDHFTLIVLIGIALCLGAEAVKRACLDGKAALNSWLTSSLSVERGTATALFLGFATFTALGCLLPTIGHDDHAYHLRLWTELANSGHVSLDVTNQAFILAPFSTDLLYAVPNLIAGEDSRGPVNFVLLVLISRDLFRAARALAIPKTLRILGGVLFVSTPLLLLATTTLQTELWATFFSTRFAELILSPRRRLLGAYLLECLALAALLAASKLTGALLGALLLAAASTRLWSARPQFYGAPPTPSYGWTALCLVLLVVTALQSYVTAWVISGNPFFPFLNGVFRSPLFAPVNFTNPLFTNHGSVSGFIGMFWNTHEYLEAKDGVAGFQYLFAVPLVGTALLLTRKRRTAPVVALFLAVVVYTTATFIAQQYVRYLLPVMPAMSLLLLAAFPSSSGSNQLFAKMHALAAAAFCLIIGTLNATFAKGAIWYLETPLVLKISPPERQKFLENHVPEVRANALIDLHAGAGARVFYDARPYGATLAGTPLYSNWYNPQFREAVLAAVTEVDIERLVARFNITHVLFDASSERASDILYTPYNQLLAGYLGTHGVPLTISGRSSVYAINRAASPLETLFDLSAPGDFAKLVPSPEQPAASGLRVNANDRIYTATLARGNKTVLKVETQFECETPALFLVQINWDQVSLAPHYRPITCVPDKVNKFTDVIQAPLSAQTMTVYFNTHASSKGSVTIRRFVVKGR